MPDQPKPKIISAAVEGVMDEVVLRSLIHHVGAQPGGFYGKHGKQYLLKYIQAYVRADRKSTRLNSSHIPLSRMPTSA